ncbi:hypothetical protein IV417_00825 [Alphaproteobacteria bacterium KMM 3653]|uniref:DUF1570 domain-containing protein n=1 Tax=Harenicola maris TaxID=2841044 RepID=A0AAP2CK52_9RHOB|nr:hypothetical protein [Harenicola maris]
MRWLAVFVAVLWAAGPVGAAPLFENSVASNDIDFIRAGDPSAFHCMGYLGAHRREMPHIRRSRLFREGTHVFEMRFTDGARVEVWVTPSASLPEARRLAQQVAGPLGRLPPVLRLPLDHVVINEGDGAATAEEEAQFFILYAKNMAKRLRNHDLEETVFHEAMHASLQSRMLKSAKWRRAVKADGGFVTRYAASDRGEDFAESGLFAYTALRHPERLGAKVLAGVKAQMPARLAFFAEVFPRVGAEHRRAGAVGGCP